jgi:hypothetical protein
MKKAILLCLALSLPFVVHAIAPDFAFKDGEHSSLVLALSGVALILAWQVGSGGGATKV